MKIIFNTDKTIVIDESQKQYFATLIENRLIRFQSQITRIEIHLSDVNGNKEGQNDIQCKMEIRIGGHDPIVVTSLEDTIKRAITSAITKAKTAINTTLGRLQSNDH